MKNKYKVLAVITAVVLAIVLTIAGITHLKNDDNRFLETSVKAQLGQLEDKSDEEIRNELNRIIEDGSMAISINQNPVFIHGAAEGTLQIENSPANRYAQTVIITRDDTGEEVYNSGVVHPNYHIQTDRLDVDLDEGEYECTATFIGYSYNEGEELSEYKQVGTAAAKIKITVLS